MNATTILRITCIALLASAASASAQSTATATSYAGQQAREIKSLSAQEVESLHAGKGMALAKAAELNGYPGPAHVLELSQQLALTNEQAAATTHLMAKHKARAMVLGAAVVNAERQLDTLFREQTAQALSIDEATARIGTAQAQLRAEHLRTHLEQTAILTAQQIQQYNTLRGYTVASATAAPAPAAAAHQHHHKH